MDCENEFLGVYERRNEREYEEKNSMDSAGGNDTFHCCVWK